MWVYNRREGKLYLNEKFISYGYSGHGVGLNNPDFEQTKDVGPLPAGSYYLGKPRTSKKTGPVVIDLSPFPRQEMYGRIGFEIHGDSIKNAGQHTASDGCIILPRSIREMIGAAWDRQIKVI